MHVLRLARVAGMGAWGGRRDRTDQIRVRHLSNRGFTVFDFGRNRYENGIQTFDTANVSSPIHFLTCRIL